MESDPDTAHIAKVMIDCFGNQALQVVQRRIVANSRDGDIRMAQFWWRVALAARLMNPDFPSD